MPDDRAEAMKVVAAHYVALFGNDAALLELRKAYAMKNGTVLEAEHRSEPVLEVEAVPAVRLDLHDAVDLVLDGVLDGHDAALAELPFVEEGVEGGRLAAAGGSGDQHHAGGPLDESAELRQHAVWHT